MLQAIDVYIVHVVCHEEACGFASLWHIRVLFAQMHVTMNVCQVFEMSISTSYKHVSLCVCVCVCVCVSE